ncbi:hypothetical protein L210DRAFT_799634, partial [Boletus edulis BED1]
EGCRHISWIWLVCGYGERIVESNADQDLQDYICVEWCKAHAQAHRWAEKVELLVEEQRQVLQFLHWQ